LDFDEKCELLIFSTIMTTGLGFGLEENWPWPRTCCPRTHPGAQVLHCAPCLRESHLTGEGEHSRILKMEQIVPFPRGMEVRDGSTLKC